MSQQTLGLSRYGKKRDRLAMGKTGANHALRKFLRLVVTVLGVAYQKLDIMTTRIPTVAQWIMPALLVSFVWFSTAAQAASSKTTIHNLREVGRALAACMHPLPIAEHFAGMRLTIRVAFNARGEPLGPPRFTFVAPTAPTRFRDEYKNAIINTLKRCTPLPFSAEFGAAMAGVPMIFHFNEGGLYAGLTPPELYRCEGGHCKGSKVTNRMRRGYIPEVDASLGVAYSRAICHAICSAFGL